MQLTGTINVQNERQFIFSKEGSLYDGNTEFSAKQSENCKKKCFSSFMLGYYHIWELFNPLFTFIAKQINMDRDKTSQMYVR